MKALDNLKKLLTTGFDGTSAVLNDKLLDWFMFILTGRVSPKVHITSKATPCTFYLVFGASYACFQNIQLRKMHALPAPTAKMKYIHLAAQLITFLNINPVHLHFRIVVILLPALQKSGSPMTAASYNSGSPITYTVSRNIAV